MKEELIRILNNKLDDITSDINSLNELNSKITNEENNLSYASKILDLFKKDDVNDIMNFPKLDKEDFGKVLDVLDNDVKASFTSNSCNYDGLVYLINGINNGVSLTLTEEQTNAIEYLLHKLNDKKEEYQAAIDGYMLVKDRYLISSVDELKLKENDYQKILDELGNNDYVSNTDLLLEAVNFSSIPSDEIVEILKYLLEYNANIYKNKGYVNDSTEEEVREIEEKEEGNFKEEIQEIEENKIEEDLKETDNESFNFDFLSNPVSNDYIESKDEISVDNDVLEENKEKEYQEFHFNDVVEDNINASDYDFNTIEEEKEEEEYIPEITETNNVAEVEEIEVSTDTEAKEEEPLDVLENSDNYKDEANEKNSTNDLQILLAKYEIQEDNNYINELVVGDINGYEGILNTLKDNDLINSFKKNSELLVETLLYSDSDSIKKVLDTIRKDLSVDDEDYEITTKIVVNTIPSIFINNGGNYDNFIKNIQVFKELELNLINLFDFSKELFVANNDTIMNNLDIVKKYDVQITYQNAKYLLLLNDVGDRLDYYVESVYLDKEKNEMFDGLEYINIYTAKLNVVTDETIKRLRYCSENGKKVFGNKPKSLTGEITNLKVNSLDIGTGYYDKFFNNEFTNLTKDEVREYIKLIHSSSNVGNYSDELDFLEKYHNASRYIISDINISYNKVLRNYCILRSYSIDAKKALHFAVCYNLVITKDEYDKLRNVLDELGGNL